MSHQQIKNNSKTVSFSKIALLMGYGILFFISLFLFVGTWQKDFLGKDSDVFNNIPKYIGENAHFFKVQPHTPLATLTFIISQKLFSSISQHYFINWIIHTLNTLLLFHLLSRKNGGIASLILALILSYLFLIHPLNIYTTSFLINRGGLLSSLLTLLFLIVLYTKDTTNSYSLSIMFISILLMFLSVFSHFISIVLIIPILYFSYIDKSKNESSTTPIIYRYGVFYALFLSFILLMLYHYNNNKDLYEIYPPFKYFNIISGLFILFLFPTSFFPLQYFEINSLLSIPIALTIFFFLLMLAFYFYKNSKTLSFLSSLLLISSIAIFPIFQRLDLSMCNSSYFVTLSILMFCYFSAQNIYEKNKTIFRLVFLFFLIILSILSIFSFQLTYELKDPERLWLACAGNYPSNTEAWKYLARTMTKKAKEESPQKNTYLEKSEQAWNTLLELNPEHIEALQNKSLLCLESNRYDEAKRYIAKAIGLNPFDSESIRMQIRIIEKEIKTGTENKDNLIQLYNSYISLYLINKDLNTDEKNKFLDVAQKLLNYEQGWEILKQDFNKLKDQKEDFQKGYDDIKKALNNIPVSLLVNDNVFKAPYQIIADYYEKKGMFTLSQAWLSLGVQKEQDNKDLLIKLGTIYGKSGKPEEFIEKWANYFNENKQLWENIVQECINKSDFVSAEIYMGQTSYSTGEKYVILSRIAVEKGYKEQAKLWLEKAKENNPPPELIQEINELINKIS